jgi:hypothetical protein
VYPAIETPNVITAIAAAPSDANRLYVGLYNGAIWRSNGPPCNALNCWTEVAGPNINGDGLPNAVISSIDVHPTNPNILYVTYSGFNVPGGSVWKSVSGGTGAWSPVSAGLPGNVPMNVIKINPGIPTTLWLGADRGVYRSINQGASWEFFGPDKGMPNVPVYDIAIDNFRGRVYSATHGRGMFVLTTSPVVYTLEGWMDGEIWDILVYGEGFTAPVGTGCTVDILLEDGTVCASGSIDSYGNTQIKVGPGGSLVTDRQFVWHNRRVIAACLNSKCVGPTPISTCLADPNNKISSIKVTCGGQTGFAKVAPGCPQQTNPPSTVFQLDPPLSADPGDCVLPLSMETTNAGSFDVMIGITATTPANGGDRILCGVRVDYKAGDNPIELAKRTRDAINGSPQCQQAKITAETPMIFPEISDPTNGEDFLPSQPIVVVHSQGLNGGQLVVSIRVRPGTIHCPCFELQDLGLMLQNQLAIMKTTITTAAGGAQGGGRVVFSEYSQLGTCEMSVPTLAGETAVQIATKIETALLNMNEPGTRRCEARQNPYDVKREGADLITIAPFGLKVCTSDPKVGIVSGPDGLNLGTYEVDQPFRRYFALSLHSGIAVPLPDFSDNYKSGLLGELDFEYRFSKKWSGEAILGRYSFGAKTGTALPDKNITAGIVNLKYYMKSTGWQPYFAGGLGVYFPDDQNTTAGLFLGAGVAKTVSTHFLVDMAMNGHILFNSAPNTSFVTAKVGVKYIF